MLNIIWPIFIIISYIYAIITGKVNEINNSVFESCESAVKLTITFLGTMCLWSGIMRNSTKNHVNIQINKFIITYYENTISRNSKR